jgi:hypothetical protein
MDGGFQVAVLVSPTTAMLAVLAAQSIAFSQDPAFKWQFKGEKSLRLIGWFDWPQ